jgi:hypothetical protein
MASSNSTRNGLLAREHLMGLVVVALPYADFRSTLDLHKATPKNLVPKLFHGQTQSTCLGGRRSLCFAKIPCAVKIVRFPAAMAASSRLSLHPRTPRICPGETERYIIYIRMEEPGRFHDATLVRTRQPVRNGGAAFPVAHEKGRDLRCEFFRLAFPSRV